MALRDPNLPAGAIVEGKGTDRPIRNDGVELRPIEENPWYRLATIFPEPEKSRQIWNALAIKAHNFSTVEIQSKGLPVDAIIHSSDQLVEDAKARFARKYPECEFPDFEERVEFFECLSFSDVDLRERLFPAGIWIDKSNFRRFDLSNCLISDELNVLESHFDRGFLFMNSSCTELHFEYSTFKSFVDLSSSTISEGLVIAGFNNNSQTIYGTLTAKNLVANEIRIFQSKIGGVRLKNAKVSGQIYLGSDKVCVLNRGRELTDLFEYPSVSIGGIFRCKNAIFERDFEITDAVFSDKADFNGSNFFDHTVFSGAVFEKSAPTFFGCKMHQDTRFTLDAAFWPTPTALNASNEKEAFTRLRQIMVELHKPDDQHFFFQREMAAKAFIGPWYDRLGIMLYGWVSDYGWSVARPLVCLSFVWLLGMAVFLGYFLECCSIKPDDFEGTPFWAAFGVSFSNTFGFLGIGRVMFAADLYRDLPQVFKFVSGLQTVLGVIFLFFFGLGLRNRFRLK